MESKKHYIWRVLTWFVSLILLLICSFDLIHYADLRFKIFDLKWAHPPILPWWFCVWGYISSAWGF